MNDLHQISMEARKAFYELSGATLEKRNECLHRMAEILRARSSEIFAENEKDYTAAKEEGLAIPLLHRLRFGTEKLEQVCSGLEALSKLPDPIGKTEYANEITEGLRLYRVTCPIGVIGVIFESRPDALIQISSLCIKSGNAALLKGGREALRTNRILTECVREALEAVGLSKNAAQLLESREEVQSMLKEDRYIDLIIPRGSNAFVRYIMDNSLIPVLGHADGICHVYIDKDAETEIAVKVAVDSKVQNVSVCNAAETLLIHEKAAGRILPELAGTLAARGVEIRGDSRTKALIHCREATEADWKTEYLDYIISVKIVDSMEEAIDHINLFGSHHTDSIITANETRAELFMEKVDSAGVYWNASTRFADGFVYGLGAEVGISTGKIHARGPMGLEGLTTYKYKLYGKGHTLAEMKDGTRKYTHRAIPYGKETEK